MIYVRRDPRLIPADVLRVAERAQAQLEALAPEDRAEFIRKKGHIWRAFAKYLRKMSYGKCWYSESPEPQSFFDVDHFRPKLEARRSESECDPGYEWLAFSWENFRLSAHRSNRPNRDEDTEEIVGKAGWFPLLDGSPKACWDDRCEATERPVLIDPVKRQDVRLLDVLADGRIGPSDVCIGAAKQRVEQSCQMYGLNLPWLKDARLRMIREVTEAYEILMRTLEAGRAHEAAANALPVDQQVMALRRRTFPDSPYARAARAQLARLAPQLLPMPEEFVEPEG